MAALFATVLFSFPARAQTVTSSGNVTVYPALGIVIAYSDFDPGNSSTQEPAYLLVEPDGTFPTVSNPTEVNLSGGLSYTYLSPPPIHGSLLDFENSSGPLLIQEQGLPLALNWTTDKVPSSIYDLGVGAIAAYGLPMLTMGKTGADVTVVLTGSLNVGLSGTATLTGTLLNPGGLRTAQLSGIMAASFGDQTNSSTAYASGTVTVVTGGGSSITMSSDNPTVLVAGISATGATGPGDNYATNDADRTVSVSHSGSIYNSAGSGVGIMATASGAQYLTTSGTLAIGAPVSVTLNNGSLISLTGTTGVGVFAASEAYTTSELPKNAVVQGGTVSGTINFGATVTVGGTNSILSIGVLAISTGTDGLIDPYSHQSVNVNGHGNGGTVVIANSGTVTTTGAMSIGLAALSTGGAGIVTSTDTAGGNSYLGNSGDSSDGGGAQVTVTNTGTVITLGTSAHGIVAISSAGGGIINNDLGTSSTGTTTGLIIGDNNTSSSDPASNGGAVDVLNSGYILTGDGSGGGAASAGIIAQSIGGGGGTAGGKPALFVGDKGGGGGDGATVTVTTTGGSNIVTLDDNSNAILAQSIGGGGGNGGNAKGLFVAVGGQGGNGGDGGEVILDLSGTINTQADNSIAVIGQSIGGGGGNGGGAKSVGLFFDTSIGGKGAQGGTGGTLTGTLEAASTITTVGNNSSGLVLQSVGGGGGSGGVAYSGSDGILGSIGLTLGGAGDGGGEGGTVSGLNLGTVTTGVQQMGGNQNLPNIDGADSNGVLIQSIGGGGGQGGGAIGKTFAAGGAMENTVTVNLTFGGSGGKGSNGGSVTFDNLGQITTYSDGSIGIAAQSIGGGGGSGGDSTAQSLLLAGANNEEEATLAFGGSGGGGGNGSTVTVQNGTGLGDTAQAIATYGQNSPGILAQSIGGGGGTGGLGTAKAQDPTLGDTSAAVLTLAMGGSGGSGGTGGGISVTNFGSVYTGGSDSKGIIAQSIGGGGGNADGATSAASNNNVTANVDVGGKGGSGGSAEVSYFTVSNYGSIQTVGGDSTGILAQSIGGGGGNAGSTDAEATIGTWGDITGQLSGSAKWVSNITIGQHGGGGGAGGIVAVYNLGIDQTDLYGAVISTTGERANGIQAQSISGGGGNGGAATALSNSTFFSPINGNVNFETTIGIGGDGGDSSDAGQVTIDNGGVVTTQGYSAQGIFAQSIGGGGGTGADGSVNVKANLGLGIDIDGHSGTSGAGGEVDVDQYGLIQTTGADSAGILAQSISGGGGVATAGTAVPFNVTLDGTTAIGVNMTLGFNLKTSSSVDGGTVNVTSGLGEEYSSAGGTITTAGDWSAGIIAQSIGGGGGKATAIYSDLTGSISTFTATLGGTYGSGAGGAVNVNLTGGMIATGTGTSGFASYGILAQSIGGGGGIATDGSISSTGTIRLGGTTDNLQGHGGEVTITGSSTVITNGFGAHGIVLQSIGGGGGLAGSGNSLSSASSMGADVILGGDGAKGNGGAITGTSVLLSVTTHGDNAYGVVAQSIGGGGGIAATYNGSAASSRLGDTSSSGTYNGGAVNLDMNSGSQVSTSGLGAHGLVIQSIGGGGGIANPYVYSGASAGLTTTLGAANDGKAEGYGGDTYVSFTGTISTSGDGAYGAIVQTIGGGGGIIGNYVGSTGSSSSSGDGTLNGTTTFMQYGTVSATGTNSVGVFVQNRTAGTYGNTMTAAVYGHVTGGSGTGAGIWMDGGAATNYLTIGLEGTVSSRSGLAILYTAPDLNHMSLHVTNEGTVNGSVNMGKLGDMSNYGVFNSGAEVTGTVNVLGGTLNPGGFGPAQQTLFHSDLKSTDGSLFQFNIYSGTNYDSLAFDSGASASVYGEIEADFDNIANGNYTFTLIGGGSGTNNSYTNWNLVVNGLGEGSTYNYFFGTNNSFNLVVEAVPEPNPALLLLLGGAGLLIYRSWRWRRAQASLKKL